MKSANWILTLSLLGMLTALAVAAGVTNKSAAVTFGNPPQGIGPLDWGQWGGSSVRNNTPDGKDIPSEWQIGTFDKAGKWNKDGTNVEWVSHLGSQSYGN